jgi:hypothetical protein
MKAHETKSQFGRFLLFPRLLPSFALVILAMAGPAVAVNLAGDISGDSSITMICDSELGPLSVNMSTALGSTTITINRDGQIVTADIPLEEVQELWAFARERGAGALGDASPAKPTPDQAFITFTFRNGLESHSFSVYGVDFVDDARYLEITTVLMDLAKRYEASAGQREE